MKKMIMTLFLILAISMLLTACAPKTTPVNSEPEETIMKSEILEGEQLDVATPEEEVVNSEGDESVPEDELVEDIEVESVTQTETSDIGVTQEEIDELAAELENQVYENLEDPSS